jgi:predicted amidohydrolase
MKIAAAQTIPKDGDIAANFADHIRLASLTAEHGAQLIVFPEMSLTGYQMEGATEHSFSEDDELLASLKKLSAERSTVIIAGAPMQIGGQLYIGAFVLSPDNTTAVYTKQFLHQGEEKFFRSSFDHDPLIMIGTDKVSTAICADITNPLHAENAAKRGSDLYAAGIFFTPDVPAKAHTVLSAYAKQHSMNVLMANYGGPSWGLAAGGCSGFWTSTGELVGALDNAGEGLLIATNKNGNWSVAILKTQE